MSLEEQGIWAHYWAAGHSLSVQGAKLAYLYSQECLRQDGTTIVTTLLSL